MRHIPGFEGIEVPVWELFVKKWKQTVDAVVKLRIFEIDGNDFDYNLTKCDYLMRNIYFCNLKKQQHETNGFLLHILTDKYQYVRSLTSFCWPCILPNFIQNHLYLNLIKMSIFRKDLITLYVRLLIKTYIYFGILSF